MKKSLLVSVFACMMLMVAGVSNAGVVESVKGDYKGSITIDMLGDVSDPIEDQKVTISEGNDQSHIQFTLHNFNFSTAIVNENIVLDNVPVEEALDGTVTISDADYSKELSLGGGAIKANVKIDHNESYVDGDNILVKLNIIWNGITIKVDFTGTKESSGIHSLQTASSRVAYNEGVLTTLSAQTSDYSIYNVSGQLVKWGTFVGGKALVADLANGIYLVRVGNTTTKFVK